MPEDMGRPGLSLNAIGATRVAADAATAGAVSWAAIFAGAAAAAALSLILLVLGVGLGLSAISPWSQAGIAASTFGVATILWLTLTQGVASGMGGYLAGRLRVKWLSVHTDEVYFRDTAHGFLAWAVATLGTAAVLTSAIGSIVGGTAQAGASVVGGMATSATTGAAALAGSALAKPGMNSGMNSAPNSAPNSATFGGTYSGTMDYLMDLMFRKDVSASVSPTGAVVSDASSVSTSAEVTRIFFRSFTAGALPASDMRYVSQVVSQRTGLPPADAEKRVNDIYARAQTDWRDAQSAAKEAADSVRKASAYSALWLFVSLLIGAFCASLAATLGGRQRDA
jgi:hypothetical protein